MGTEPAIHLDAASHASIVSKDRVAVLRPFLISSAVNVMSGRIAGANNAWEMDRVLVGCQLKYWWMRPRVSGSCG